MISLAEARTRALVAMAPAPPEALPLLSALGLYLAEPAFAGRDLPGCDNSAMDGYAVRAAATGGASRDRPARLRVVQALYAGSAPGRPLRDGETARIFTGAPLPEGADCVVRQEAARQEGEVVLLFVEARPGEHVRRAGEEIRRGQPLFPAGQPVDAAVAGVLASLGHVHVRVRPRPRVAVLTVGDELVPPGTDAAPYQVYESNGVLLSALALAAGAGIQAQERLPDDDARLRAAFERWLPEVDLLVTSGGASVGEKDRVKQVLSGMGATLTVDGVALKPGKPVGVATLRGKAVVVLPGNPGAASVAFDQFARPLLLAHQGVREERVKFRVRLDGPRHKQAGLTYLLSARTEPADDGLPWARIRPQGAGQILQNVDAEGWAVLPAGRADFERGEEVALERFSSPRYLPWEG